MMANFVMFCKIYRFSGMVIFCEMEMATDGFFSRLGDLSLDSCQKDFRLLLPHVIVPMYTFFLVFSNKP